MPTTEIVNKFYEFDDVTLEKLYTIGRSILTPMDTELTSVDFATMVDQVFKPGGLADSNFPEWTDRSSSDFGRFLVELFAIFSDKNFFYMNHYSREGFGGTAELYRSIFHKAVEFGFKPPSNKSARGNVQIVFSQGVDEVVPRGAIILGINDLPNMVYLNTEFTISASTIDQIENVEFMHGKLQRMQQSFDGDSVVIDVPNIVDKSIEFYINGEQWFEVDSFLGGSNGDKHFMVFYDEDGRAEIIFASGGLGMVPEIGALTDAEFVVGGGYVGDIEANLLNTVVTSQTTRNLLSYTQFSMSGGSELLPIEELRQVLIGKKRHQDRVVTPEDAEYFAKELPFVEKAYADVILDSVYIYALPKDASVLSPTQKDLIKNHVTSKLLMGYFPTVESPILVAVTASIDVYLSPTTPKYGAELVARQTVNEYLDPLKNGDFGKGVNKSTLASLILQRVSGAQNVVFTSLHRTGLNSGNDDLNFIPQELVDLVSSNITINIIGGLQ